MGIENNGDYRFAAAYIRVSTDIQVDLSPESQMEEIRKFAARENLILLNDQIYSDDGISGRSAEHRPGFMNMISTAKSSDCPFSTILVWKFSRFARNQEESIFYKSILRSKCGVDVVSVSEPLVAGPFGSLIERIIEWMDEFYSIRLGQEVRRSMTLNARNGVYQSAPPLGYSMEDGKLTVKPEEAEIVRYMFELAASGESSRDIAFACNSMGLTSKRGLKFNDQSVRFILSNPVYIGKVRWNSKAVEGEAIVSQGSHEPIVSVEMFEAAGNAMDTRASLFPSGSKPIDGITWWLTGLVRCAKCGKNIVMSRGRARCSGNIHGTCSYSQSVSARSLEDALVEKLRLDASTSTSLEYSIMKNQTDADKQAERFEAAIRKAKSRKTRLQDAYLSEVIELEDFKKALKDIDADIEKNEAALGEITKDRDRDEDERLLRSAIEGALVTLTSDNSTPQEKNMAFRSVVENCVLDRDAGLIAITYRLAL